MRLALLIVVSLVPAGLQAGPPVAVPLAPLRFVSRLPAGADRESSGIVRSRTTADLFWTHNDSGDEPRIYPLHRDGTPYRADTRPGVVIEGASHVDWEDIATLEDGRLVIADLGNNANARQDLAIYLVAEPRPEADCSVPAVTIPVRYPDQVAFPPAGAQRNFDCEALFTVGQTIFVLTKHRGDSRTALYRLNDPQPGRVNAFERLGDYDIGGMVVAADCDPDGKRLLVLTMQTIWLFERDDLATPFFSGRISSRPYFLPQAEGICFADAETALLTDEVLDSLFEVKLSELRPVMGR
ncbi:hypothetical protein Pan44_00570 [Caulifigura coniformis]|uniref:Phytase-like domain-containing protein n=1 Tax=Caulifigura coniformis TaxID=2527983 RepID=A0A517S7G5_9PLAN|nr:hypothetical protein [Caulifigura coniformis]QDT52049.1 hypothetical protein Pan44_00570 [Caulifigura coniformis]